MEKTNKYLGIVFVIMIAALFLAVAAPIKIVKATADFPINIEASSLDYKNSTLYYTDVINKQICANNQNTNEITSFDIANTSKTPELVIADFDGNIFYTQSGTSGLLDESGSKIDEFGSEHSDMSKIYDLDCDINNNIYALGKDVEDKFYVFKKSQDGNTFEVFCELGGLNIDASSKISVSLDQNFLVLFAENAFYKVEENTFSALSGYNGINTITGNILDIKLDYHNTLFVLTNQKMFKASQGELKEFSNAIFANSKTFELEYLSGEIFCVTDDAITKIDSQNFVDSLGESELVDYKNQKYECCLIKTTKKAILYSYDNCIYTKTLNSVTIEIPENTTLCAISKTDSDFYFVLINNLSNENITGFIKCSDVQIVQNTEAEKTIKILHDNAPLYIYPSSLDQSFLAKDDENNPIVLHKNTLHTLKILNFASKDFSGNQFSQIEYNGKTYYINTNYYIENASQTINPIENQSESNNNNAGKALTSGEIVGIVLISLTAVLSAIFILIAILKKDKNKKEL